MDNSIKTNFHTIKRMVVSLLDAIAVAGQSVLKVFVF